MPYLTGHDPHIATDTPDEGGLFGIGSWSCQDWLTWNKSLADAYGQKIANDKWIEAWNNVSFWKDWNTGWCQYESFFRDYLKNVGIEFNGNVLSNVWVGTGNVVKDSVSTIENAFKTLKNTSEILAWGVPIAVVGLLVVAVWGISSTVGKKTSKEPYNGGVKGNVGRGNNGQFKKAA